MKKLFKTFKKYKPQNLTGCKPSETKRLVKDWQEMKTKMMIGHPASCGHGVDGLQKTGCIVVWFGLPYSLEYYEQSIGRIFRQGQTKCVSVIRILCEDTIDGVVLDALEKKDEVQSALLEKLKR